MTLNKTAKEIAEKPCSNFFPDNDFTLTQVLKDKGQIYESPICYNLEPQTLQFPKSLHYHYKEMIKNFANLKSVFSEPPILSYHRNQNLCNL